VSPLDLLRRLVRLRLFDPMTHGTYELGRQLLVPEGQSVYDPTVFKRYDPATQQVVPRADSDGGIWELGLDELIGAAQDHMRADPERLVWDRYDLVLAHLGRGSGLCLDACTASPERRVRDAVEALGYSYRAVDIDGDGVDVGREDVTALSFADNSVACILSLDTLEHVEDYRAALAEFARVLEPGGLLLVHVPAYFFDRESSAPLDPDNDPWGHVRYFSGRELVTAVIATGLIPRRVNLALDYGSAFCVAGKPAQR
jgi:SAM-dependent methyltransferase